MAFFQLLKILFHELPYRWRHVRPVDVVTAALRVLAENVTIRPRRAAHRKWLVGQVLVRWSVADAAGHEHVFGRPGRRQSVGHPGQCCWKRHSPRRYLARHRMGRSAARRRRPVRPACPRRAHCSSGYPARPWRWVARGPGSTPYPTQAGIAGRATAGSCRAARLAPWMPGSNPLSLRRPPTGPISTTRPAPRARAASRSALALRGSERPTFAARCRARLSACRCTSDNWSACAASDWTASLAA